MEFLQIEIIGPGSLNTLPESVERGTTDEVGRELAGALLGSLDFSEGLCFGLIASPDEQFHRLFVGHLGAVHGVIEDRVEDCAKVELQLVQPESQIATSIALVEHHLLGVDGPAFGEHPGGEDFADRRSDAVGVVELDVVSGIGFMDREDLKHVLVVLLEEGFLPLGRPV